ISAPTAHAAAPVTSTPSLHDALPIFGSCHQGAIGCDQLNRHQVVAGETELAVEPTAPAAKDEPTDPRGRYAAAGSRQPVRLAGPIEVGHGCAAAECDGAGTRVDRGPVHPT